MIEVTRLNGNPMVLNSDLIKSAEGRYKFNPGADQTLAPGATLIVLGEVNEIASLRKAV